MTHLKIIQNNNVIEEVTSSLITLLYDIAHAGLDSSSDLLGRLHVYATYLEYITELHTAYPELYISCDVYYLYLGDPTFTSIMALKFGDGTGCTLADLLNVTGEGLQVLPSFAENTNITDATGFKYLTRLNWTSTNYSYISGFRGCTNLQRCELPEGMKRLLAGWQYGYIGFFKNCSSLTHVVLPSTITIIDSNSFENCSSLLDITIPSNVTAINGSAFAGTALTQITLPTVLETIGYGSFSNSLLTNIYIPNSVTTISSIVFEGCPISSIEFDQSVGSNLTWNSGSMYSQGIITSTSSPNTQLKKLDFPERLTTIGNSHPFRGLTGLTRMIFRNPTPISISDMDVPSGCKIYVPDAALNDYKAASGWSSYADRIFGISLYATDFPND